MIFNYSFGLVFALVPRLLAQDGAPTEPTPIATDRPDFTESALAVPAGRVQLESGFALSFDGEDRSLGGPEALFRIGMTERFELRFGVPNYSSFRTGGVQGQGFGDVYLGAKLALGEYQGRTAVALIPAVFLPTGAREMRGESASPEIKIVASQALSSGRAISGMIYLASVEENGRRELPTQFTLSLGGPVRGKLAFFAEGVADVVRGARPAFLLHSGLVLASGRDAQFDVHCGLGLTSSAPDFFLAGGYSVRF